MSEREPGPDPRTPGGVPEPADGELSAFQAAALLLSGRRAIATLAVLGAIVGLLFGLLSTKEYRATAKFAPQENAGQMSNLASIAGEFGVQIPSGGESQGPEFYRELLTSREILTPVVSRRYAVHGDSAPTDSAALLDLADIDPDAPAVRISKGIRWLRNEVVTSSVSTQTGIVNLDVTTRWPDISYQIASAILQEVQDFNIKTRHTQAQAQREFLEGRVEEARKELRSAESELQTFLQQNRQFEKSPELVFQNDRLNRAVTMRQEIYTSLSQSYEQARIEEVKNTPVITVLETPIVPPVRESRGTALKGLLGLVLGILVGVGWALARHTFDADRDPEAIALKDAWADTRKDLGRLIFWRRTP